MIANTADETATATHTPDADVDVAASWLELNYLVTRADGTSRVPKVHRSHLRFQPRYLDLN